MTDDATGTSIVSTPKPAKVQLSLGERMAKMDSAVLEAEIVTHRDALMQLGEDPTMPADMQAVVKSIAALASPDRPGLEEMGGVWTIPRASIAQPTTTSDSKPESAKNGDIFTSSGQLLPRPYSIIPVVMFEENINFGTDTGNKNPICQSIDGKLGAPFGECLKCPHLPFGKQNGGRGEQKQTECYTNIVVIALAISDKENPQVVKFQFGKTSNKAGRALLALVKQQPMVWKQSYQLDTAKGNKPGNLYWIYEVKPTGKNNDEHVNKLCSAINGLYTAERHLQLSNWYSRTSRAPMIAAQAEGEFSGGALDAGLGASIDVVGVEPDLSTPGPAATTTPHAVQGNKHARNSSKPM